MRESLEVVRGMLGLKDGQPVPHSEIFKKLPKLDDIKDKEIAGVKVSERFEAFCKKAEGSLMHSVGDPMIDEIFREEAYVRFIIQLNAQLVATDKLQEIFPERKPAIDLKQWSEISETLGDTGVSVSFASIMAKRRHPKDSEFDLCGSFAGGLGNKLGKEVCDAIIKRLKELTDIKSDASIALKNVLQEKLVWADNIDGNSTYIPYASVSVEQAKKVEQVTVLRESLEELGELIIADYKLKKGDKNFVTEMSKAFSVNKGKEGEEARKIFQSMGVIVDGLNYNEKSYKNEVEPLFRSLLKTTQEGQVLLAEFSKCLGDEIAVTDITFPKRIIEQGKSIKDKEDFNKYFPGGEKCPAILVPQSICYIVDESKLKPTSAFLVLKNAALNASRTIFPKDHDRKQLKTNNILFEAKGFIEGVDFKKVVELFCESKSPEKSRYCYIHENLSAIRACVKIMDTTQVEEAKQYLLTAKDLPGFKEGLKLTLASNTRSPRDRAIPKTTEDVFKNFFEEPLKERSEALQGVAAGPRLTPSPSIPSKNSSADNFVMQGKAVALIPKSLAGKHH